jgi:hypothetical protein
MVLVGNQEWLPQTENSIISSASLPAVPLWGAKG